MMTVLPLQTAAASDKAAVWEVHVTAWGATSVALMDRGCASSAAFVKEPVQLQQCLGLRA